MIVFIVVSYLMIVQHIKYLPKSEVAEFELKLVGVDKYTDAAFGLQYAFMHGFKEVLFSGVTYTQISPGVILIDKRKSSKNYRYRVTLDQRMQIKITTGHYVPLFTGDLSLFDMDADREIASFWLPHDRWPGDEAAGWLATIMRVDKTFASAKIPSIQALSVVKVLDLNVQLNPREIRNKAIPINGCDSKIEYLPLLEENGFREIRAKNWTMAAPNGLKGILCTKSGFFIITESTSSTLDIIWIGDSGKLLGRGEILNKNAGIMYDYRSWFTRMELLENNLNIEQSYFSFPAPFLKPISPVSRTGFTVPLRALRPNEG